MFEQESVTFYYRAFAPDVTDHTPCIERPFWCTITCNCTAGFVVCSAVFSLYYLLLSLKMVICLGALRGLTATTMCLSLDCLQLEPRKARKNCRKRRADYLAALSKYGDLSHVRICSRHFISDKPAYFFDHLNPDWLPTLNINSKLNEKVLMQ